MRNWFKFRRLTVCVCVCSGVFRAAAQANLPLYTDHLVNGFQDWSWGTRNLANTSPVHSGSDSISASLTTWQALSFEHPDFNLTPYASLSFWANGGGGGQALQVYAEYGTNSGPAYSLPTLQAGAWQQFVIPLNSLGVAGATNVNRFTLQLKSGGGTGTFYMDDIQLGAAPAPALVHLSVDADQVIRTADARWFGLNTAVWDNHFDSADTLNALKEIGCRTLRFPGGSLSDEYHWATDTSLNNTWRWATSFNNFMDVATNLGAQVFITVNYGTGTSNEAAAWVRAANVTNHCHFEYWEIGNECYGSWETDSNSPPHDPYTYATRAAGYITAMKAADPTIKVGVVVATGENSFVNDTNHAAVNLRTGQTHYGWTPVLLATLRQLGVTPDFVIYHFYPEYTVADGAPNSPDSDPLLLQTAVNWAGDAANLRQQISDYFGPAGSNIELCVTENNSDAGAQGRQSTSLVNGLYLADSLGQLMKTEFNSFIWWDLRNGADTAGDFDSTLYGWRSYGDLGLITGATNRNPAFYADKLMHDFVQPGDTVLGATSDYLLLSAYAARAADGALSLLVINKDPTTNFTAQVSLANFTPAPLATVRSYGIPQDDAARTNSTIAGAQDIATNEAAVSASFTDSFAPYSLTLFTLAPAAAQVRPVSASDGRFVLQLEGQPGTPYVLESSPDLANWTPVSTNRLASGALDVTNAVAPGAGWEFWRAVWQP